MLSRDPVQPQQMLQPLFKKALERKQRRQSSRRNPNNWLWSTRQNRTVPKKRVHHRKYHQKRGRTLWVVHLSNSLKSRKKSKKKTWNSCRLRLTAMSWVTTAPAKSQAGRWMLRLTSGRAVRVIESVSVGQSRSTVPAITIVFSRPLRALAGLLAKRWLRERTPVSFSCPKRALKWNTESFRWSKQLPMETISGYRFNRNL